MPEVDLAVLVLVQDPDVGGIHSSADALGLRHLALPYRTHVVCIERELALEAICRESIATSLYMISLEASAKAPWS